MGGGEVEVGGGRVGGVKKLVVQQTRCPVKLLMQLRKRRRRRRRVKGKVTPQSWSQKVCSCSLCSTTSPPLSCPLIPLLFSPTPSFPSPSSPVGLCGPSPFIEDHVSRLQEVYQGSEYSTIDWEAVKTGTEAGLPGQWVSYLVSPCVSDLLCLLSHRPGLPPLAMPARPLVGLRMTQPHSSRPCR